MRSPYCCHSDNLGPAPRVTEHVAANGERIRTRWKDIACGHMDSARDDCCAGCEHRRPE